MELVRRQLRGQPGLRRIARLKDVQANDRPGLRRWSCAVGVTHMFDVVGDALNSLTGSNRNGLNVAAEGRPRREWADHRDRADGGSTTRSTIAASRSLSCSASSSSRTHYRDKLLEQYDLQVPLVRGDDESIAFDAYTIDGEPDKLVVYERWTNESAARDFSIIRTRSIETGALPAEAMVTELPDYLNTVVEIDPY